MSAPTHAVRTACHFLVLLSSGPGDFGQPAPGGTLTAHYANETRSDLQAQVLPFGPFRGYTAFLGYVYGDGGEAFSFRYTAEEGDVHVLPNRLSLYADFFGSAVAPFPLSTAEVWDVLPPQRQSYAQAMLVGVSLPGASAIAVFLDGEVRGALKGDAGILVVHGHPVDQGRTLTLRAYVGVRKGDTNVTSLAFDRYDYSNIAAPLALALDAASAVLSDPPVTDARLALPPFPPTPPWTPPTPAPPPTPPAPPPACPPAPTPPTPPTDGPPHAPPMPAYGVPPGLKPDSMSLTCRVELDGAVADAGTLLGYVRGALRGVQSATTLVPNVPFFAPYNGTRQYALSVVGDNLDLTDPAVTFRYARAYDLYDLAPPAPIDYASGAVLGTADAPVVLTGTRTRRRLQQGQQQGEEDTSDDYLSRYTLGSGVRHVLTLPGVRVGTRADACVSVNTLLAYTDPATSVFGSRPQPYLTGGPAVTLVRADRQETYLFQDGVWRPELCVRYDDALELVMAGGVELRFARARWSAFAQRPRTDPALPRAYLGCDASAAGKPLGDVFRALSDTPFALYALGESTEATWIRSLADAPFACAPGRGFEAVVGSGRDGTSGGGSQSFEGIWALLLPEDETLRTVLLIAIAGAGVLALASLAYILSNSERVAGLMRVLRVFYPRGATAASPAVAAGAGTLPRQAVIAS